MIKRFSLIIFLLSSYVYSQSPDWSVNVNDFQYSMTFTVFLNLNGNQLTNSNDKVGAFVNDESRGEATVIYNTNADKYLAYLTVYGNVGETITFKIYDSLNNQIVTTTQSYAFSINGNVGGVFQSYSIANPVLANEAIITTFSFKDIIAEFEIIDNKITITVNDNVDITNLSPVFTTVNNGKVYLNTKQVISGTSIINFSNVVSMDVLSEDESVLKTYEVTVQKTNSSIGVNVSLTSDIQLFNTHPATIYLTASEALGEVELTDFETTNCVVSKVSSQNNIDFTMEVIPLSEDSFSLKLKENSVSSTSNETNNASNVLTLNSDTKKPFIKSILRSTSASQSTADTTLMFEIIFNEPVVNVNTNAFYSVTDSLISVQRNTDSNYTITVSNLENHIGVVGLFIQQNTNITDIAGNNLQTSKMVSYEK